MQNIEFTTLDLFLFPSSGFWGSKHLKIFRKKMIWVSKSLPLLNENRTVILIFWIKTFPVIFL